MEEGGPEKWEQFTRWLYTPPVSPPAVTAPGRQESSTTAAARAAVGDEAAAFDAMAAAL